MAISFPEGLQVLAPVCVAFVHVSTPGMGLGEGEVSQPRYTAVVAWEGVTTRCDGTLCFQTPHLRLSLPTSLWALDFPPQRKHRQLRNAQTNPFSFVILLTVKENSEQIVFRYADFRGIVSLLLYLLSHFRS